MAITITQAAADHVTSYLANRGEGEGVRLGVRTTGCSGMAYILEFVDKISADDAIFDSKGDPSRRLLQTFLHLLHILGCVTCTCLFVLVNELLLDSIVAFI